MLVDQVVANDKQIIGGRTPRMGEDTLEILSEESIKVYLYYLDQLKNLFATYIHENFNAKKKVISWKEIEEKNRTMVCSAFLKMVQCHHMIPNVFNPESLNEFIMQTIPPITREETDYFEIGGKSEKDGKIENCPKIIETYNKDTNPQ
eukprot:CAMPEP_0116877656 /NCGR_PEP_ID=MMETSP0463-20121206/9409_1 /TAXON_ID=181622 /ORGANISM="Strombidinopsis sp, Strain SopsisLIS2011" /LENGTH=147 /DNA_ID=CAMNT_0004525101 /DNA_START=305 /DNA_END=748 /DNA_ORIENTATION=+